MIAKDPEERRLYNERLKMERDERARNLQARQEGIEAGTLIGRIQLLQELNGLVPQSAEVLASLPIERLALLEQDLQRQLRERS